MIQLISCGSNCIDPSVGTAWLGAQHRCTNLRWPWKVLKRIPRSKTEGEWIACLLGTTQSLENIDPQSWLTQDPPAETWLWAVVGRRDPKRSVPGPLPDRASTSISIPGPRYGRLLRARRETEDLLSLFRSWAVRRSVRPLHVAVRISPTVRTATPRKGAQEHQDCCRRCAWCSDHFFDEALYYLVV